jgi:hypothetical protein
MAEGQRLAEEADLAQWAELARRLEAAIEKIDAIRAELESIAIEVEIGP